jgi:hypothetical protein
MTNRQLGAAPSGTVRAGRLFAGGVYVNFLESLAVSRLLANDHLLAAVEKGDAEILVAGENERVCGRRDVDVIVA